MTRETRCWAELPMDIIRSIASRIPPVGLPCFGLVCKSWWQNSSVVYPADECPLLLHYKRAGAPEGKCYYYSPCLSKTFVVKCSQDLSGTTFRFAKAGWLMLSRGNHEIILIDPLSGSGSGSGSSHQIAPLPYPYFFTTVAFASQPRSSEFMIFGIRSIAEQIVDIGFYYRDNWDMAFLDNNKPFLMSFCNPVFHRGRFYCLGSKANLGVFTPNTSTGAWNWKVLAKPKPLDTIYTHSFLVESDAEELVMVQLSNQGDLLHVLRLNQTDMVWQKIKSLRNDQMLFVGTPMSLLATASVQRMGNKIYVPWLQGEPETVPATLKFFDGRVYFECERSARATTSARFGIEGTKRDHNTCSYYSLENGKSFDHYKSKRYIYSIWYEPGFNA